MSCNVLVLNVLALYMLDSQGSIPGGDGNSLFSKASRLALGAIQPPIQWVPMVLYPG